MKDEFQGMNITDIFEKLVKEDGKEIADLNSATDLEFWGMAFFLLRGISTEEEAYHHVCNLLWRVGDHTKRSKKQNRKLFDTIANDYINSGMQVEKNPNPKVTLDNSLWERPRPKVKHRIIDGRRCIMKYVTSYEFEGMDVAEIFEKITKGGAANLHNEADLRYWAVAFWLSRGLSYDEAYCKTWDLSELGDPWTRSKKQNRELFNAIANDEIRRVMDDHIEKIEQRFKDGTLV